MRVGSCLVCPRFERLGGGDKHLCWQASRMLPLDTAEKGIPEWCPLEDCDERE